MPMLSKGRSPEEVLRSLAEPAELAALDAYARYSWRPPILFAGVPPSHHDLMHDEWSRRHAPLEKAVIDRLKDGRVIATALALPLTGRSCREPVAAALWDELTLFFDKAEAQGRGLHLVQVGILTADEYDHALSGPPLAVTDRPVSREPELSDDSSILSIHGERLVLRGEIQQEIVRQLLTAHRDGKAVRTAEVLRNAGSNCDTVSKAFSGSPHWAKLKTIIMSRNGLCWIEP